MKNTKRFTALMMVLVLLFGLVPSVAGAQEQRQNGFVFTVAGGNATIITYEGTAANVAIPSQLGGATVTAIGTYAFFENETITAITIPDSVTTVGAFAFSGCSSLLTVNIGAGLQTLSDGMFHACSSLVEITIPGTVKTIGMEAFSGATSLSRVTLQSGVERISTVAFLYTSALSVIIIPPTVISIDDTAFQESNINNLLIVADAGSYASLFADRHGIATNTVEGGRSTPPTISAHPQNWSGNVGQSAQLSVTAAGSGTLTYQWYSNTSNSNSGGTRITGATNNTYNAPTVSNGVTYYYCLVYNSEIGKIDSLPTASDPAKVTVVTKEQTPNASINYANETLTGLASGSYTINGSPVNITGAYDINGGWFGSTINIVKTGNDSVTIDSDPQNLNIPARPNAPVPGHTNCTTVLNNDGTITGVTTAMEYSTNGTTWTSFASTNLTGLSPGTFYVRVKATDSAFKSENATVTIGSFTATKEPTPAAQIDFTNETLTGLINGSYTINGSPVNITGAYNINRGWLGDTINIVKIGTGTTTLDSDPQSLNIPARPNAPAPRHTDCTTVLDNDGTITGVTAAMEYSTNGTTWTSFEGTSLTGLTPGVYYVRIKSTDSAFKSENATVTIGSFTATKEPTPAAQINFANETLIGLSNGSHTINGTAANITGAYNINPIWIGNTISIVKIGTGSTTLDSDPQSLSIPARPSIPAPGHTNCTTAEGNDGTITDVTTAMEYSTNGTTWTSFEGTSLTGLTPGTYFVRIKATASAFRSEYATVTIGSYTATKEPTPAAEIDFTNETLTGLTNGSYTIGGSAVNITGAYSIAPSWIGETISIVKKGTGTTTLDSDPQSLGIPARPNAPAPRYTNCTTTQNNDGTITDVTTAMEYSTNGTAWTGFTGTSLTGLAPGAYFVRIKATASAFKSENTTVTIRSYAEQANLDIADAARIVEELLSDTSAIIDALADAPNEAAAIVIIDLYIRTMLAAEGITIIVEPDYPGFVLKQDGDASNPAGTDGAITFKVTVEKEPGEPIELQGHIDISTATPYPDDDVVKDVKDFIEGLNGRTDLPGTIEGLKDYLKGLYPALTMDISIKSKRDPVNGTSTNQHVDGFILYEITLKMGNVDATTELNTILPATPWNAESKTYSITYRLNGGTQKKDAPTTYKRPGDKLPLPIPSRTGYTFVGWFETSAATGGSKVTSISAADFGNKVYWARWTGNTYNVRFNKANTKAKGNAYTQRFTYGTAKQLLPNKFKRNGFVLRGWAVTAANAASGKVAYGPKASLTTFATSGTKDLYAVWGKVVKPKTPEKPNATNKAKGKLSITYKKVSGADGYRIQISTDRKFAKKKTDQKIHKGNKAKKLTVNKFKKKNLKVGTTYYVRVTAFKLDSANKRIYGKVSESRTVKLKK